MRVDAERPLFTILDEVLNCADEDRLSPLDALWITAYQYIQGKVDYSKQAGRRASNTSCANGCSIAVQRPARSAFRSGSPGMSEARSLSSD